jgi:hypothetical protein
MSNPSNTKRTYPICETQAERWSRRYVDVRADHGCAAIQPEAMDFQSCVRFGIGGDACRQQHEGPLEALFYVRVETLAKGRFETFATAMTAVCALRTCVAND